MAPGRVVAPCRCVSVRCYAASMSVRAHVKNGRLLVDEPTGLPEGTEVELVAADDVDELPPEERAKLFGFLAESIRSHSPGKGTPADVLLAELRQR
jgi:hypothetical protein